MKNISYFCILHVIITHTHPCGSHCVHVSRFLLIVIYLLDGSRMPGMRFARHISVQFCCWEKRIENARTLYLSLAIFRNKEKVPRDTRCEKEIDQYIVRLFVGWFIRSFVRSPEKFSFIVRCRDLDYHFLPTFIPGVADATGLWIIVRFSFAGLRVCTRVALSVQLTFAAANKIHRYFSCFLHSARVPR